MAKNGKDALELLSRMSDIELIITDSMMPEMDGLRLVEAIRALPQWNPMPILIASAHADLETVQQAQRAVRRLSGEADRQTAVAPSSGKDDQVQPVVLRHRDSVLERLEISPEDYGELIRELAEQLIATLSSAVLEQGESDGPVSENLKGCSRNWPRAPPRSVPRGSSGCTQSVSKPDA